LLWKCLATAPADSAHEAIWELCAGPGEAVALLGKKLRPVEGLPTREFERWVADLDTKRFTVREKAVREMDAACDRAELALRKALADGKPTLELRRRIEHLLARLSPASPEVLRLLRALEVLENIGTPEARKLLEKLAGGVSGARLTREAKAALAR